MNDISFLMRFKDAIHGRIDIFVIALIFFILLVSFAIGFWLRWKFTVANIVIILATVGVSFLVSLVYTNHLNSSNLSEQEKRNYELFKPYFITLAASGFYLAVSFLNFIVMIIFHYVLIAKRKKKGKYKKSKIKFRFLFGWSALCTAFPAALLYANLASSLTNVKEEEKTKQEKENWNLDVLYRLSDISVKLFTGNNGKSLSGAYNNSLKLIKLNEINTDFSNIFKEVENGDKSATEKLNEFSEILVSGLNNEDVRSFIFNAIENNDSLKQIISEVAAQVEDLNKSLPTYIENSDRYRDAYNEAIKNNNTEKQKEIEKEYLSNYANNQLNTNDFLITVRKNLNSLSNDARGQLTDTLINIVNKEKPKLNTLVDTNLLISMFLAKK